MDPGTHLEFRGSFRKGLRDGKGVLLMIDGSRYEGMWREDQIEGAGTYTSARGRQKLIEWRSEEDVFRFANKMQKRMKEMRPP